MLKPSKRQKQLKISIANARAAKGSTGSHTPALATPTSSSAPATPPISPTPSVLDLRIRYTRFGGIFDRELTVEPKGS